MEVARYVQSTQNREFGIVLQRVLQLLLFSIVMQNTQIFHGVQPCLLLLLFLHSQTVEMFCLNTAIQYLDSIYVGRDCHLCCPGSKLTFFKRTRVYCCKSSYAHQTSQKKLVSGLVIQIISPKVLQESTTILQLKVYITYVVRKLVGHPPQQECPINPASFFFPFVCNLESLDHQFFYLFSFEVSHHKARKVMNPNF